MGKMAVTFALGVLICVLEQSSGAGQYYWAYPGMQSGALTYPAPVGYQPFAPYAAFVPVDCDENKVAEEGSDSSSSSSSSSSEESGASLDSSSSSSEEEEAKPEESGSGESTESGEEAPEGEAEGSSEGSEEPKKSGESGEGKSKEEEKKKKKEKPKSLFPPVSYTFPARPVQQYIYSAPLSQYMPVRTYSAVVQQQPSYPVKSINSYYGVPISGGYNAPVFSGAMNGPAVVKSYSPVTRFISSAMSRVVQSPVSYVPSNGYTYWSPSGNLGYYKK